MKTHVALTVAESKRLIAKGVANMFIVKKALTEGMIAIGRGTTNGRIVEEILGKKIDRGNYIAGRVLPAKGPKCKIGSDQSVPDVVLKNGELVEGLAVVDSAAQMKQGDVYIKGCNAINYQQKMCGILIGHPLGGTISALGAIVSRKVHLVLPVGLEKSVFGDINELSMKSREADEFIGGAPSLMPVTGEIVTEIEALDILAGVKTYFISAGGIAGAEGAVWLILEGEKAQLEKAIKIIDECREIEHEALF
jgi:hypothetical protein